MAEQHPLVCRFGAFGDMVLLTPLLRHLHRRSGLPCDLVAIGGWNHALFANMPWVRKVYTIGSRSTPYWLNPQQRELVAELRAIGHLNAWVCETDSRSYRLLERAGIDRHNSVRETDLPQITAEHYCDKWLGLANLSPPAFDASTLEPEPADTELFVVADEIDDCRDWLQRRRLDPEAPIVCKSLSPAFRVLEVFISFSSRTPLGFASLLLTTLRVYFLKTFCLHKCHLHPCST